jgi:hypothetical protein
MSDSATTATTAGTAFLGHCRKKLHACQDRIRHGVEQLNEEQVWWRPHPSHNSIANLILHLCGNLRQWIISAAGGEPDHRDRPAEFAARTMASKAELLKQLEGVIAEADAVLARVTEDQLLQPRRVQGFEETVLSAVFDSVTHLNGHTQEIISFTRIQLGDAYRFAWVPTTPEQGA